MRLYSNAVFRRAEYFFAFYKKFVLEINRAVECQPTKSSLLLLIFVPELKNKFTVRKITPSFYILF